MEEGAGSSASGIGLLATIRALSSCGVPLSRSVVTSITYDPRGGRPLISQRIHDLSFASFTHFVVGSTIVVPGGKTNSTLVSCA